MTLKVAKPQCGQSLVELALIFPLLFLIVAGGVDLARAYFLGIETSNGAAQAALYVADNASNSGSPPTSFTAAQLKGVVTTSYGGSLLSCPSISVTQNQSISASEPNGTDSDTYPSAGSFYEYVTVTCVFPPLTPLFPVNLTLRSTSSDFVVEGN